MNRLISTTLLSLIALSGAAVAEPRTVVMDVKMSCPMSDPVIYRRTMSMIPGVSEATVSYDDQTVTVDFDDQLVTVADLMAAFEDLALEAVVREAEMPADGEQPSD